MIHVDVHKNRDGLDDYIVETSTDGGGWKLQYVCDSRAHAESTVRIMGVAWSYAGVEWRATSCGYPLNAS